MRVAWYTSPYTPFGILGCDLIHSGIGLRAAQLLAQLNPLNRLVLVCRSQEKAEFARDRVLPVLSSSQGDSGKTTSSIDDHLIPLACDQTSLDSVRNFVKELRRKLDETYRPQLWSHSGVDVLCLNAAVLCAEGSEVTFTPDGIETTFQTNHLSPFLIAYLTKDLINPCGRVIFSTSGLHLRYKLDFSGAVNPESSRTKKEFEMLDGSRFRYKESYSISKLCNVATCAELQNFLEPRNAISACFSPGLMLDSGLFRHQHASKHPVPEEYREAVMRKAKTVEWGAGALAYMCWADEPGKCGAQYWRDETDEACNAVYGKHFSSTSISTETISMEARKQLWHISADLAGINYENHGTETYKYAVA